MDLEELERRLAHIERQLELLVRVARVELVEIEEIERTVGKGTTYPRTTGISIRAAAP